MSDGELRDRVAAAERDIDTFFEREFKIGELYRPALIDAMLDVIEQLVTTHPAPPDRCAVAIQALHIKVKAAKICSSAPPRSN